MRVRTALLAATLLAGGVAPLHSVMHAAAANITCRAEPVGAPDSPVAVSTSIDTLNAAELDTVQGGCLDLSGETFSAHVHAFVEYFNVATLSWVPAGCSFDGIGGDAQVQGPPVNVSAATFVGNFGCVWAAGSASLNALHRLHTQVTTTITGTTVIDDETSEPYLISSVSF